MTRPQKIWLTIAILHLGLVTYNGFGEILKLPVASERHPAGLPIRWYAAMTGANNSYGFFKKVDNTCKVEFTLVDADGNSWTDKLSTAENHEAELRFMGSPFMIADYGDALTTSWAATMFGRHPKAARVDINFVQYNPVNLDEFRNGARAQWFPMDPKIFLRKDYLEKTAQETLP